MPSRKIVRSRLAGWCSADFAHPSRIQPGDLVLVTTYFPRDESVSDFGVKPFTRTRTCNWCVQRDCRMHHRSGYECEGCGFVQPRAFWLDRRSSDSSSTEETDNG